MIEVFNYLLDMGFSEVVFSKEDLDVESPIAKKLTPEFSFIIAPEGDSWESSGSLFFYLVSKEFADLMTDMFASKDSLAWSYLPRKLRRDKIGGLGSILCGFEPNRVEIGNSAVIPSNYSISLKNIVDHLDSLGDTQHIFKSLYDGELGRMLILVEGAWVYLYLARKLEFSISDTLSKMSEDSFSERHAKKWNMKQKMDEELVKYFYRHYDRNRGQ